MASFNEAWPGDVDRARLATGVTAYALGLPAETIRTLARGRSEAAFGRRVAMYLCHVGFEMSFSRVSLAFGRDRSTVGHACRLVEARRDDPVFDAWIDALETALRETPAPRGQAFLEGRP